MMRIHERPTAKSAPPTTSILFSATNFQIRSLSGQGAAFPRLCGPPSYLLHWTGAQTRYEVPAMPSGVFDSILLRDSWSTAELRAVFSDESRVQKWYEVEATLASEQAAFGIVPREA